MILKALYDYYHRMGELAPMGFEKKEITFLIVIDVNGNFIRVDDTRNEKKVPKKFTVPRDINRTGKVPKSQLLWDNGEYVLGIPKDEKSDGDQEKKERDAKLKNSAFIEKCREIAEVLPDSKALKAVLSFYENGGVEKVMQDEKWESVLKDRKRNISFILQGDSKPIPELEEIKSYVESKNGREAADGLPICLITGSRGNSVVCTSSTMIAGSQSTAKLVSFQKGYGYDSYYKEQCGNAPMSTEAEAAYTTALKTLLDKNSRNKFLLGNRTFVFWASNTKESSREVESSFFDFIGSQKQDNPNAGLERIRNVLSAVWSGESPSASGDRFYVLGLAPNAARIAVVYWNECSVRDFAGSLLKHFEDMEIIRDKKDTRPYFGLYNILSAVALGGKSSEVQQNLPEALLKSVLQATAYPFPLYTACLRRINAELSEKACFSATRMAIIKAFLNRQNTNHKKIEVMLDKENKNIGYLCGRLFAVLVKIQEDASGINTIAERYMSAASSSPATVFSTILNLSIHHSENLKSEGAKIFYEKLKQEIIGNLPPEGFPAHLDLQDQGRFFVGYYQQRQDFFANK